jgi:hypothetical protein
MHLCKFWSWSSTLAVDICETQLSNSQPLHTLTCTITQTKPNEWKSTEIVLDNSCSIVRLVCMLAVMFWTCLVIVCLFCVSLIDASVAEEVPDEGYYQEEEEDYPGHFANQGKPSFESYPIPSLQIAHLLVFKLNCIWIARVEEYCVVRFYLARLHLRVIYYILSPSTIPLACLAAKKIGVS